MKLKKKKGYQPFAKNRPAPVRKVEVDAERLVECAIIRGDTTYSGHHTHRDLRQMMGDDVPSQSQRSDEEGYMTSEGRFVGRYEASQIAYESGQSYISSCHELLSCDVDWKK